MRRTQGVVERCDSFATLENYPSGGNSSSRTTPSTHLGLRIKVGRVRIRLLSVVEQEAIHRHEHALLPFLAGSPADRRGSHRFCGC